MNLHKSYRGSEWYLLFHHFSSSQNPVFFSNEEEAKFSSTENKYSVLSSLNDQFLINGKFEFILEYPSLNSFLQWKQSVNPLFAATNSTAESIGFSPIDVDSYPIFQGLKYRGFETLISGICSINCGWYYSIGSMNNYYSPNFPGPYDGINSFMVNEAYLWIKIGSSHLISCGNSWNTIYRSFQCSSIIILLAIKS